MRMLPDTSPDLYLSGTASLNIPSPEGTGDWHTLGTFSEENTKPIQFLGDRELISIIGKFGIEDRTGDADRAGIPHSGRVFASTHSRAVVDMVIKSVLAGRVANHVHLDDWLPEDKHKQQVARMLVRASAKLTAEQRGRLREWVKIQFRR